MKQILKDKAKTLADKYKEVNGRYPIEITYPQSEAQNDCWQENYWRFTQGDAAVNVAPNRDNIPMWQATGIGCIEDGYIVKKVLVAPSKKLEQDRLTIEKIECVLEHIRTIFYNRIKTEAKQIFLPSKLYDRFKEAREYYFYDGIRILPSHDMFMAQTNYTNDQGIEEIAKLQWPTDLIDQITKDEDE